MESFMCSGLHRSELCTSEDHPRWYLREERDLAQHWRRAWGSRRNHRHCHLRQHKTTAVSGACSSVYVCLCLRACVRPPVCLPFSLCLSVRPSFSVSLSLSFSPCLSVRPSLSLSVFLSLSFSPCLSVRPSLSVFLSLSFSPSLSVRPSVRPSLAVSLSLSLPPPSLSHSLCRNAWSCGTGHCWSLSGTRGCGLTWTTGLNAWRCSLQWTKPSRACWMTLWVGNCSTHATKET